MSHSQYRNRRSNKAGHYNNDPEHINIPIELFQKIKDVLILINIQICDSNMMIFLFTKSN